MKEKLRRFSENGGFYLILGWLNIGIMLGMIINSALDKSVEGCLISVLVYLPWTLLFFNMYQFQKEMRKADIKIEKLCIIEFSLLADLDHYRELYGDLPKEENKEEQDDTNK